MKKSFLLLAVGLTALSAVGQENNSVMIAGQSHKVPQYNDPAAINRKAPQSMYNRLNNRVAAKTTGLNPAAVAGTWFTFNDAHDDGSFTDFVSGSGNYSSVPIIMDSTVYVPLGTPTPFYWWCHGLGTSFDPTSKYFSSSWANTTIAAPGFIVASTDDYYIDSIFTLGRYRQRNAGACDTLHIDITVSAPFGGSSTNAWNLSSTTTDSWGGSSPMITESPTNNTYRFCNAKYKDSLGWDPTVNPVYRIVYPMCTAEANDTDITTGWNNNTSWAVPVAGGLHVKAGEHVSVITTLHQSQYYAHGTDIATVNEWQHASWFFTDDEATPVLQKPNDFNTGLLISTSERYNVPSEASPGGASTYMGNVTASPAYYWTPGSVNNPYYWFYVRAPHSTDVKTTNALRTVTAYPNPANDELSFTFNVLESSTVNITLTNMVGQVVAKQTLHNFVSGTTTFNTSDLAGGMYIYNIEANGDHSTGRVVISH